MEFNLYDASGQVRERSSLVMDLGKIPFPKPSSLSNQRLKLKQIPTPITAPVDFAPISCAPDSPSSQLPAAFNNPVAVSASAAVSLNPDKTSTIPSTTSWAKVLSSAPKAPQTLKFVEPVFDATTHVISIPPDLLAIGRKKYSMCLVGQFIGNAPKLGFIHVVLNKLWGRDGEIVVSTYKDGLFLFQFPNDSTYSRALYRGPWHVGGIPLILWPWHSSIKKPDSSTAVYPVWVQLRNVPLELLTEEGLSYLASNLGTSLHSDQDCSRLFRGDRANVCVEIDFSKPLQQELIVDINGEKAEIAISYSWKPQFCDGCKTWGHHVLACPNKRIITQWIQKAKPPTKSGNVFN
ncbi:hypothetical protein Tsubulata_045654 [Turnera subulata]|uniref:DUF4283 domain-containing protein n=1 Tax=Turnera subulata TaxID=218843 RepID=A0A9Q0JMV9_9ROSI|nr:hypothetical protein Tsubulata_045654 [Turnera subulata]